MTEVLIRPVFNGSVSFTMQQPVQYSNRITKAQFCPRLPCQFCKRQAIDPLLWLMFRDNIESIFDVDPAYFCLYLTVSAYPRLFLKPPDPDTPW